jgi:hypothetical protein
MPFDWLVDTLPKSAWHPQQPIDEPLVSAPTFNPNKSQARSTLDTQRVEADSARQCFPVIPTESTAASVRTFKRHNVNLVLCRPLLHVANLLVVLVHCPHRRCSPHNHAYCQHLEHRKVRHFGKRCEYGGRVQQRLACVRRGLNREPVVMLALSESGPSRCGCAHAMCL